MLPLRRFSFVNRQLCSLQYDVDSGLGAGPGTFKLVDSKGNVVRRSLIDCKIFKRNQTAEAHST